MKHIDDRQWALLKRHAASHLTDPNWLGGAYCVTNAEVHGRVLLPRAPWEAVLLSQAVDSGRKV